MSNLPKLRFREYQDSYRLYGFEELFTFSAGKNIKQSEASPEFQIPCVRYGELYHMYGEVIKRVVNRTNLSRSELTFSKGNEILLPSAGEDPLDIGSASALTSADVAIGRTINVLRPLREDVYSHLYMSYYINQILRRKISALAKGVSISNVYNSDLKTLEAKIPSVSEQQKIADFLTTVDTKIEQLTRKEELLKQYKKGVMQKIFSQEIRFKADDGSEFPEWEETRLGRLVKRRTNKNTDEAVRLVLTNSASRGIVSQTDYFDKDIANQNNLAGYYVVETNDFVYNPRISSSAPVGPIKRNHLGRGVMSPLYSVFEFISGNLGFYEHYFETSYWHQYMNKIANFGARHDRMNVTTSDFYDMPVPFPSAAEQWKIVRFIENLDNKLAKATNQLNYAKTFKKGLLQQMFV